MLPINPPGERLGQENAVLSGSGTRYYVPDFEGCLSVKSVLRGAAVWLAEKRRFSVNEGNWLILNDRQRYTIEIESFRPVTTFCLFFERGFVEEIHRCHTVACRALIDDPQPSRAVVLEFFNRIEAGDGSLPGLLKRFQDRITAGSLTGLQWDEAFRYAGEILVWGRDDTAAAISRLPAVQESTRVEVYRRLLRGRDFLLSSLAEPIRLKHMAEAACLSPFHFHRAFRRAFGETPHGFLTRQRLERAAQLLRHKDLSVTEICLGTGFESVASFSGLFRRRYRVPPSQFRKIREAENGSGLE